MELVMIMSEFARSIVSHRLRLLVPASLFVALTTVLVFGREDVAAEHIPGATYSGAHTGGGSVEFDVSGDGSGITRFAATNIPGDNCTFDSLEINFVTPVPIVNHSFSRQVTSGLSFDGSFASPGAASGTLRARQAAIPFVSPACDSGTLNWNASTNAPTPTNTLTPTMTSTPTSIPTATPTLTPGQFVWGDNNCSGEADPIDSLLTLRFDAGLSTDTGDCPDLGDVVEVANASPHPWGDVDCGGDVNPVDSLKLLRFDAGLDVAQADGCPDLGSEVTITES
jgi:hypothetical protein